MDATTEPHRSIEDMAPAYIEEIRALRPHGPYYLTGNSGGGIVAFEMAQQLKALDEEVPLLVFFGTYHPHMAIRTVTFSRKLMLLRKEGSAY
jgi:thioesterase domain-containing protein